MITHYGSFLILQKFGYCDVNIAKIASTMAIFGSEVAFFNLKILATVEVRNSCWWCW